jgi:hypothetical protein
MIANPETADRQAERIEGRAKDTATASTPTMAELRNSVLGAPMLEINAPAEKIPSGRIPITSKVLRLITRPRLFLLSVAALFLTRLEQGHASLCRKD